MPSSHWHRLYTADINASPAVLFGLVADMPNYGRWLPGSASYGSTTDVSRIRPAAAAIGTANPANPAKTGAAKSSDFDHQGRLTSSTQSMCGNCGNH